MSSVASTGCCLWARSKVIACFVTFPCKLRLMALINFQRSQSHSVRWWLFDIVPLSLSDEDNCFKLALGYWLLKFNRRANDRVVACLEMTLESAKIRHPQCDDTSHNKCGLTLCMLLSTKTWDCTNLCLLGGALMLHDAALNTIWTGQRSLVGVSLTIPWFCPSMPLCGLVQLRRGLGNLMQLLP